MNKNEALDSTNPIGLEVINLRKERIAEVDKSIEEQKAKIEFAEAIKELRKDPRFLLVIENGYFEGEGKRITECLLEPTPLKRDQIQNMVDMISSIRNLKTFLMFKENDGGNALHEIESLEDYRTRINSGEFDEQE